MRIVSFNVRYAGADDGPNAWPFRRASFFAILAELNADVLCLQEVLEWHLAEIQDATGYETSFGLPREDGHSEGEMCAILPRADARDSGVFWLSETPDVPGSRSWDTACTRVCTWAEFASPAPFRVYNVHLDHVSRRARLRGMEQILRHAESSGVPVIIAGDLNATPDSPPLGLAREFGYLDPLSGGGGTYHEFGRLASGDREGPEGDADRIDYILMKGPWEVESWGVLRRLDMDPRPSDHWPVWVDAALRVPG